MDDIRKFLMVLLGSLLFLSLTAPALAKDQLINDTVTKQKESIAAQVEASEPKIIKELVERRKPNEKTHLLEDGSMLLEIHQNDIHYVDLEGRLQDINTDLIDELELADAPLKNYSIESQDRIAGVKDKKKQKAVNKNLSDSDFSYTSLKTPFVVDIPKTFVKGYGIEQGGKRLKFIPVNISKTAKAIRDTSQRNKVVYKNAWPHTDVELIVVNEGIKENIILHNASAPQSFSFEVQGNLDDFNVLPAWLEDSKGTTREVALTKRVAKNKTYMDLTWDSEGLQYPILIDPTVQGALSKAISVNVGSSFTVGSDKIAVGGKKTATGFTESYRSYLQFNFDPGIRYIVKSANLILYRGGSLTQSATTYIDFQPTEVLGAWVEPMNSSNMPLISGATTQFEQVHRYYTSLPLSEIQTNSINVDRYMSGLNARGGIVNVALIALDSDAQINSSIPSSESVILFTTPALYVNFTEPSFQPTELTATNTTSSSITLSWKAPIVYSSDISYYQILQNGTVLTTTTGLSSTINNLSAGNYYRFTIRSVRTNGAISDESSAVVFINNASATYVYTYSNSGKLTNVKITIGNVNIYKTYLYDDNGNLIQVKTTN